MVSFRNGNANIKDGMLAPVQAVEPEGAQLGGDNIMSVSYQTISYV